MAIGAHHFDNEPNFMTYRLTTNHMIISAGDPVTALKHGYFSRHEIKWCLFRVDLFPILWCELLLLYLYPIFVHLLCSFHLLHFYPEQYDRARLPGME